LGFLGIIAVIMFITGGFKWMMAGGSEQEVTDAKNRIKNAVIGLVIVFASYVIVNFVVSQLSDATGAGGGSGAVEKSAETSGVTFPTH
ncbi:MAG: pilin, partial [Candidatus Komeilibacteria bacterium]|nr:pilin [Candidatus Komeilibacteria bacterium]